MDVNYDNDNYSYGHGDFRPAAGRKRKEVTTSIQTITYWNDQLINLKNIDRYEETDEQKEDEDDDDIDELNSTD
ncbi:unnamed protein product [Adineta steineri]|uniref:Uncharacterized protein n=1 Tax=Adineta steineri TaxID=433720 RepID=A0A814NZF6_9BILA|nr:unnamed protein product [Adineta steineri]CAF1205077.1 unnamed protein product [Adineta steineri]